MAGGPRRLRLPGFGGLQALVLLAELAPDVLPPITVTGAITEEMAVATIAAGAVDYVLKDNLTRMASAVRRAVEGAELRRKERQAAAQARQTMYAVEHSSQTIVYVSEDGTVLYGNAAAERLGGVPLEEAIGGKIWGWSPTIDEARWAELWQAAAKQPIVDFEVTIRLLGGEERLISATLDHHERDEDSFVIVYARDITAQRAVEERAAESETLYRRIVEMAGEGIWAIDGESGTTFVNQQMAYMLGYEVNEMLGREVTDFIFEEDLADLDARMRGVRLGESNHDERRFRRKDGGEVWAYAALTSESGPGGEYLGSFGMFTDITARRQSEAELRLTQLSVDCAADLIHWIAPEGRLLYVSDSTCRRYGCSREQML